MRENAGFEMRGAVGFLGGFWGFEKRKMESIREVLVEDIGKG